MFDGFLAALSQPFGEPSDPSTPSNLSDIDRFSGIIFAGVSIAYSNRKKRRGACGN
jgi:hypothetical protein